jgi:hypothetical protein
MSGVTARFDPTQEQAPRLGSAGLPVLVALLSVTVLARENLDRGFWPSDLVLPMAVALTTGLIVWGAFRLLSDRPVFTALAAGLVVVVLLFGGRIEYAVLRWFIVPGVLHWTAVTLGLILLPFLLVLRMRSGGARLAFGARVAELTALILVLTTGMPLAMALTQGSPFVGAEIRTEGVPTVPEVNAEDRPDIFFIVLDAYSGTSSLRSIYDLDIEGFKAELRNLGFEVPERARANYTHTALALASMLNWDYLGTDPVPGREAGGEWEDRSELYQLLHDNRTIRLVRAAGYRTVFFSSSYPPLQDSPSFDEVVASPGLGDLEAIWLRQTAFGPAEPIFCRWGLCGGRGWPFRADEAPVHEWRFQEVVRQARDSSSATFFYIHVLLPHEPFVLGPDCEHVEPMWPLTWAEAESLEVRERYRDQVECLNRLVLRTVREILEDGRGDPVILLQSDHGYARVPRGQMMELADADMERVRERMDIFAAYRVPEGHELAISDTVTPINAMRAIVSSTFGIDLAPLEDRTYWSSWRNPFEFIELAPDMLSEPPPVDG